MNTLIAGKALYLEFRHGPNTQQVILTPEGLTASGKAVPMTCYRRKINAVNPRKTWKQVSSSISSEKDALTGAFTQISKEHALLASHNILSFTDSLFNQLITQGWKLYMQPIVVEVTKEDLDDVRMSKTPYKILGRITRCRRTLKFGEELFVS
jgi:hypothetical protein